MAKAIYTYFSNQRPQIEQSASSMDDLKFEDAAPIIKKTWAELMKDKQSVGAKIYDLILTKEITMSRLFMKTNIQEQSAIFMVMMDKVVGFLDDPASMDSNLAKLGELHVQKYGVKTMHFKHFRAAFLKAIKKYLPWTDRREQAWMWFWQRIMSQMSIATQANHYPQINQFEGRELTQEEMIRFAAAIHTTFETALVTDPQGLANRFYKNLLAEQPDIALLFENKHTSFETQSARFIAMLNHAIKLLDDTDTFTQKLESLSAQHVGYGVQIQQLQSFGDALIRQVKELNVKVFEEQQGKKDKMDVEHKQQDAQEEMFAVPEWTENTDAAWRWFWKVVVGVMSAGMKAHIAELEEQRSKQKNTNMADEDFSMF